MSIKQKVINSIIETEGGYVNNPNDSGGETNCGITIETARAYGYTGEMRDLPLSVVNNIYSEWYWDSVNGDELEKVSQELAYIVAMAAVHMNPKRISEYLQRSLNVLNNRKKYYDDIKVDGQIGNRTMVALKAFKDQRGIKGINVLNAMLTSLIGAFYINLAEVREKDEEFIYGWFANRILKEK